MKIIDLTYEENGYIQQAAELLLDCFEHCWNSLEEAIEEVKDSLGSERISRVAIDDRGNLIGWIGGIMKYDGNVWEMHPLVVDKNFQRKGIGRLLVEDFESRVREKGGQTVLLGTDDENYSTTIGGVDIYPDIYEKIKEIKNIGNHPFEFYQKIGYTIVGVIPEANGYGKPDILMAKRVKA